MYPENTFQAEVQFRGSRIRNGVGTRRHNRTRVPFVRRPADTSDTAR